MDKLKIYAGQILVATPILAFTEKYKLLFYLLLALIVVMVVDFVSGMSASAKEALENPDNKELGWSSKKGKLGILKKFGYLLCVFTAIVLDVLIFKACGAVGIKLPTTTLFGALICVLFILNELLSIIENAGRMGANIPKFFKNIICVLKNKVEEEGDKYENSINGRA